MPPLVLQSVLAPAGVWMSELAKIHLLGQTASSNKELKRPFKPKSMFSAFNDIKKEMKQTISASEQKATRKSEGRQQGSALSDRECTCGGRGAMLTWSVSAPRCSLGVCVCRQEGGESQTLNSCNASPLNAAMRVRSSRHPAPHCSFSAAALATTSRQMFDDTCTANLIIFLLLLASA